MSNVFSDKSAAETIQKAQDDDLQMMNEDLQKGREGIRQCLETFDSDLIFQLRNTRGKLPYYKIICKTSWATRSSEADNIIGAEYVRELRKREYQIPNYHVISSDFGTLISVLVINPEYQPKIPIPKLKGLFESIFDRYFARKS